MNIEQIPLRFAEHSVDAETHVNLSAVRPDGACLWIAGDETATVERLTAEGTGYGKHATFRLADVLTLPGGPDEEVDIEALARHGSTCGRLVHTAADASRSRQSTRVRRRCGAWPR